MAVSVVLKSKINLTSDGTSFKKEENIDDLGNHKYYIVCYTSDIFRFKLEYTSESTRDSEFSKLIDDVYNGIVNIDTDYSGTLIEEQ